VAQTINVGHFSAATWKRFFGVNKLGLVWSSKQTQNIRNHSQGLFSGGSTDYGSKGKNVGSA
jgi:hypothetical protein